jgi:hypothetical protein
MARFRIWCSQTCGDFQRDCADSNIRKNRPTNSPAEEDVQTAVADIEQCHSQLDTERGIYMSKCKAIRGTIAGHLDQASDKGISKKLLKLIIKKRELERKIGGLHADLENDEISELEMLAEKLGDFANTPLGGAAMDKAKGADTLASVGA